ncbi:MAG: SpoIIAA family protein [Sulfuricaulis sp.]
MTRIQFPTVGPTGMIVIEEEKDLLKASFYGELALADFQGLETAVNNELRRAPKIKLLLDLTNMSGYTVDVAWEDIKFTRDHAHDFKRIAVVTGSRWVSWLGWLPAAFTDAEIRHFEDAVAASNWLHGR